MTLDEIREKIAEKLQYHESFPNALDETTPGHYGVEDFDVSISIDNIFVNIPEKTYTFSDVDFSFTLQLLGSSKKDGFQQTFQRTASGDGNFQFTANGRDIIISDNNVVVKGLDLYEGNPQ